MLEQSFFKGGATRLFVDGNYTGNTVDVLLPQGYGLVFQQKEMLHAGLPVKGQNISEGNFGVFNFPPKQKIYSLNSSLIKSG